MSIHSRAISRRSFIRYGVAGAGALALNPGPGFAPGTSAATTSADDFGAEVPAAWFDLSLRLVRQTAGFTPPVASRAFAYMGVALFESLVPGISGGRSLSGQIRALPRLPMAGRNAAYRWPIVANAALAAIVRSLFPTATGENKTAIDALETRIAAGARSGVPPGIVRRSVERGRVIAAAIFEWSRSDGGHEGFARNFPPYVPPDGPGFWVPTPPGFLSALQPFWGSCRTFAITSGGSCSPGEPTTYSESPGSDFHDEAVEVYDAVNQLTDERRDIALFWSDDPVNTATPPGHSISLLTQQLRRGAPSLALAAESYAKLGMAVADAFISCWRVKYRVNLLRPVTYIRPLIDPTWSSLLITPPFPEFTSGHSVQSGAAATVLTELFGEVAFTDHTNDDRGLAPRSFDSFHHAAEEAAISRLYGGIHFRPAIELGLEQGRCVGERTNALMLRG